MTHEQQDVIELLMMPATHGGAAVERIDTHSAIVFLAGSRAIKLKRAVKFDYLDFSTPELRRAACEAEVRINRRAAPAIYRGVATVTREADGSLALDGAGTPVEGLVDMTRFDQDALFDRLAARDALDLALMRPLASAVAAFHAAAPHRADHGGLRGMTWVVDGNDEGFAQQGAGILEAALCRQLTERSRQELSRHGRQLDARRSGGFVRQCHGDLHLRNLVLLDGVPTLFDAIEFNDEIACADVWYDVAFLLMDLWRRQLPRHANAVFNGYAAETGDLEGLALLPLFLSCRAAVRAKTSATAARLQTDADRSRELENAAREYLTMALDLLQPEAPRLIAIGGLSGSGKSTAALSLAPSVGAAPGALVLRSDEIRKALCGVAPLDRLGPAGYAPEVTQQVYRALGDRAAIALAAGRTVIVDAVFARPADRAAIEAVASSTSVPFAGFWLDAPVDVLLARTAQRRLDPSDADAPVVRQQLAAGIGSLSWRRIDAGRPHTDVLADTLAALSTPPFRTRAYATPR
jgi:aminoglycoside phosphotransferase family enzyme/predicted kinase